MKQWNQDKFSKKIDIDKAIKHPKQDQWLNKTVADFASMLSEKGFNVFIVAGMPDTVLKEDPTNFVAYSRTINTIDGGTSGVRVARAALLAYEEDSESGARLSKEDLVDTEPTAEETTPDDQEEAVKQQQAKELVEKSDFRKERLDNIQNKNEENKNEENKNEENKNEIKDIDLIIKGPISTSVAQLLMDEYGYRKKEVATESTMTMTTKTAAIILSKERKYQHNNTNKLGSSFIYITDNRYLSLATEKENLIKEVISHKGDVLVCIDTTGGQIIDSKLLRKLDVLNVDIFTTETSLMREIVKRYSNV